MPELLIVLSVAAGLATVSAVYFGNLSVAAALDVGMVLACLAWLFLLIKVPWDLYFAARKARFDGQESQQLGIDSVQAPTRELNRIEKFLLFGALAGHALTAVFAYGLSVARPELVRPAFSLLFVASAALRPAWEGYEYLRQRVRELASQVRYPREDILALQQRLDTLQERNSALEVEVGRIQAEYEARYVGLELRQGQLQSHQISELARLERSTVQLSHRFEEVLASLSSDQELLAGVRAFARLLREPNGTA